MFVLVLDFVFVWELVTRQSVFSALLRLIIYSPARDRPFACLNHHKGEEKTPDSGWGGPVSQGGPSQSRESRINKYLFSRLSLLGLSYYQAGFQRSFLCLSDIFPKTGSAMSSSQ